MHIKYGSCESFILVIIANMVCYMLANRITSSMHTVAITTLYANKVNIICARMHMNHPIIGNSFCMNDFWGPLKLNLPRAPNMLRPTLLVTAAHVEDYSSIPLATC